MNNKLKNTLNLISLGLVISVLQGCFPEEGLATVEESVLVVTENNPDFNFGNQDTYFMPDTIPFLTNEEDLEIDEELLERYEQTILRTIEQIMGERGFTRLSEDATPNNTDLTINVAAIGLTNGGTIWYPGWGYWWDYYPPGWGWGPGWGWYYPPGFGGYPVSYSYNTGTVIISIGDTNVPDISEGQLISLQWAGVVDGLLSGVSSETQIQALVTQAFDQSPYIQSN